MEINIPDGIKYLNAAVIDFIVEFYTNLEVRYQDLEYTASHTGEVKAEFFPHFPILFKRPIYGLYMAYIWLRMPRTHYAQNCSLSTLN